MTKVNRRFCYPSQRWYVHKIEKDVERNFREKIMRKGVNRMSLSKVLICFLVSLIHIYAHAHTQVHTHRGYNQLLQIWVIEFSLEKSDWGNSSSLVFGKIWWYAEPERKEQHEHRDKCSFLGHKQTAHLPRYISRG